jgi:hypothetical protein
MTITAKTGATIVIRIEIIESPGKTARVVQSNGSSATASYTGLGLSKEDAAFLLSGMLALALYPIGERPV